MDGQETAGNSVEGPPLGRSGTEATTGWTDVGNMGKPCEIAWGELH